MVIIRFLSKLVVLLLLEVLEKCSCGLGDDDNRNTYNARSFEWHDDDPLYDSLIGIEVDGKPCCTGVILYSDYVFMAANPFPRYKYSRKQGNEPKFKMYAINGHPKQAQSLNLNWTTGNQYNRDFRNWIRVGFDDRHTTIHDVILLISNGNLAKYDPPPRQPVISRFWWDPFKSAKPYPFSGWKIAGFGFKSKYHVKNGYKLVVIDHGNDEDVLADCDEWIPRPWGHFICLNNVENLAGIQSGAALFNGQFLYGIGAFEVTKGNESILVFTDMVVYTKASFRAYIKIITIFGG